ncbi:DUF373 family protein [Metallosphaera hakonensis]|uniref:DUF373 domain-containing protein n=1 Tax=Metallosphaera hakonensis JCM 8857 = DSM 7519 TaxID=1293036 RepID=A0A2U9IV38_9CREN|nr:DUF373 family protein [Metallosphaera hakonensis]AWR99961.1 DUF373 family protein [Metallosphaera hakonensis JCM 8857 = DSM 7519]
MKTAIIYIDIDDDLSRAGVSTPVIGETKAREAIEKSSRFLALDSDFNSMVTAFNIYLNMKENGNDVEIVFVAGSQRGGLDSQMTLSKQVDEIIRAVKPDQAILVYDSPEDAKAIPVIESRLKIVGIERVIVEQHRGVEETYILLAKYLKRLVTESRYSRLFLGVPGIILFISSILAIAGLTAYVLPSILLVLGGAMLVRGFGIDDAVERWWENSTIMVIVAILSTISLILAIVNGYLVGSTSGGLSIKTASSVLLAALPYLTFSIIILYAGKLLSRALARDIKVWHDLLKILASVVVYLILSDLLKNLQSGVYVIQIQSFYLLLLSSFLLIATYFTLSTIEKSRLKAS